MTYEFNVRANLCLSFSVGLANAMVADELESARLELEKLQKSNDELIGRVTELQKTAEDKRQKHSDLVAKVRGTGSNSRKPMMN